MQARRQVGSCYSFPFWFSKTFFSVKFYWFVFSLIFLFGLFSFIVVVGFFPLEQDSFYSYFKFSFVYTTEYKVLFSLKMLNSLTQYLTLMHTYTYVRTLQNLNVVFILKRKRIIFFLLLLYMISFLLLLLL